MEAVSWAENIPPWLALILGFVVILLVLSWIFLPFLVWNIGNWTRATCKELEKTNVGLAKLTRLLEARQTEDSEPAHISPTRKEPIIGSTPLADD